MTACIGRPSASLSLHIHPIHVPPYSSNPPRLSCPSFLHQLTVEWVVQLAIRRQKHQLAGAVGGADVVPTNIGPPNWKRITAEQLQSKLVIKYDDEVSLLILVGLVFGLFVEIFICHITVVKNNEKTGKRQHGWKLKLDAYWHDQVIRILFMYDFRAQLQGTGSPNWVFI